MKTIFLALAVALPALALAEPPGLDRWSRNHPQASSELGDWVRQHPEAARLLFEWDGTHPVRSREFVTWTIARPMDDIDVFVLAHPGWPLFDRLVETHRPGTLAFMAWCRRHPRAAEALVRHPRGLQWAGNHLYAEHWQLKHPMR